MDILAPTTSVWPYFGWALACCLFASIVGGTLLSANKNYDCESFPPLMTLFLSGALGSGVIGTCLFFLALATPITQLNVTLLLCGIFATSALTSLLADLKSGDPLTSGVRRQLRHLAPTTTPDWLSFFTIGLLLLYLTYESVQIPGKWDDTSYHLPMARHYLHADAWQINPWLRFPLFPHLANLFFSAAMCFKGEIGAEILANAVPMTLTAAGIIGLVQWRTGAATWGLLALMLWLSFPLVTENLGYAYVDHWLTLFSWSAAAVTIVAIKNKDNPSNHTWPTIIGVLAGAAASTKIFGALWASMLATLLIINFGITSRSFLKFLLFAAITGTGWYIRSLLISGDPIHPAGGTIFGHYLWNAADLKSQAGEQSYHRHGLEWFEIFRGLERENLLPMCLGLLALAIRDRRYAAEAWLSGLLAFYVLLWFSFFPPTRYTLQVLPIASYLTLTCIAVISRKYIEKSGTKISKAATALAFALTFSVVTILEIKFLRSAEKSFSYRVQNWEEILHQRPGFMAMSAAFEHISQSQGSPILMQLGFENAIYFYPGTVIGDWFGPGRYSQMLDCAESCKVTSAENLAILMKKFNSQVFIVNSDRFAFDENHYKEVFRIKRITQNQFMLYTTP